MRDPEKVCERVYMVAGPDLTDGRDCCVYLVDGAGRLALIDCGCGPSYESILANILGLEFAPERIETILLTHCHIDHVGCAARFQRDYGARLVAHERDAAPLEAGDRMMTAAFLYGSPLSPLTVDRKLFADEEDIAVGDLTLKALYTPGHSPGSISAYLDVGGTRVLFGQDIHGPFHPDFGSDIRLWRDSMEKLLALDADVLCEGHFGVFGPKDSVRSYINSYMDRFAGR